MNSRAYELGRLVKQAIDLEGLRRLNQARKGMYLKVHTGSAGERLPKSLQGMVSANMPSYLGVQPDTAFVRGGVSLAQVRKARAAEMKTAPFLRDLEGDALITARGGLLGGLPREMRNQFKQLPQMGLPAEKIKELRGLTAPYLKNLRMFSPEQKEFVNRMVMAHETALEAQGLKNMQKFGPRGFAGHLAPSVILSESNMLASAPAHLRDAFMQTVGVHRAQEISKIQSQFPNFAYGQQVIPGRVRRYMNDKLSEGLPENPFVEQLQGQRERRLNYLQERRQLRRMSE